MTDTDPERMALATAIFAARAAAFENEVEGDLYRMAGNYREAYAGVTAFRDELAFWGYTVTPLAATPAPLDDLRARTALALALEETEGEWRGTGSASWMAKVVWPVMEAHLAATPAPLDEKSPQCECERRCPVHGDGTITFATPAPLDVLTEPMLTKALGEVAKVTGGALLAGGVKHRIGLSFAILEQLGSVTLAATPAPLDEWQQGYDAGYKEGQEDANLIAPTPLAPGPRAIVDGCICQKCADRGDECDYGAEPNHDECSLCERGRHVRERDREDEMEQES